MPVRSSVCTYSPTTVPSSKHSPSSLSIGHYKPLTSNSYLGNSSSYQRNEELPSTASIRRSSNASKYRLGSASLSSYSASSYQPKPSTGSYKPLTSSTASNYISRLGPSSSSSARYSHYSSASSTNSSISSASLASDYSNSLSTYSSTYNHLSPASLSQTSYSSLTGSTSASLRQFSHKVSTKKAHSANDALPTGQTINIDIVDNYSMLIKPKPTFVVRFTTRTQFIANSPT